MSLEIILVSKDEIEKGDIEPVLRKLKRLIFDKTIARKYRDGLRFDIYGYEGNSKPFEVREVQIFMKNLDKEFPFWFYFLSKSDNSLEKILFYICPHYRHPSDGEYRVQYEIFDNFMHEHFKALEEMFNFTEIDGEERKMINDEISTYFDRVNDRYYLADRIKES